MKKRFFHLALLLLLSSIAAKDYKGAELYTDETFMYGRFEARMSMAAGSGLVGSMFLYYGDSYLGGEEPWVEIDMEVLGQNPQEFQSNIISGSAESKISSEQTHTLSTPTNTQYHTYAIEWTPTDVAWFVDAIEIRRTKTGTNDNKQQVSSLNKEQSLRFNLWASEATEWVGPWDESILPVHQFINWVKVYTYTPGAGDNESDFTLLWTDDFETFNANRWHTADWTFAENRVDFIPENITIQEGTMVLSLTKKDASGFSGSVPVDNPDPSVIKPELYSNPKSSTSDKSSKHLYDLIGRHQKK